jgi:DNA-binding LacI/PurR family transcriptional regulator
MRTRKTPKSHALSARATSLKDIATHLGLSSATVSMVLSNARGASAISDRTKERILSAATELNYRPNFAARSLRTLRSYTIGVLVPEISEGYAAMVLSGIEEGLLEQGYFYFVASHRHRPELLANYPRLFMERSIEGLIAVDTDEILKLPIPVVVVSGHRKAQGVTNIVLNHKRSAEIVLRHLYDLGHRKIAFIKGQPFSSDTEVRWHSIRAAAEQLGLAVNPQNVAQLETDHPTSEPGYEATRKLLEAGAKFTALFAFNDLSAIGAMRALLEVGRRVPKDVSVVGFDDIHAAAFHNPGLTTVRQPLFEMGRLAAHTIVRRIAGEDAEAKRLVVEPELMVRQSTARCP